MEVLVTGEKYEVVTIYEKYIIIKSATDDGLKFIGPLDFGTITTGRYVKTAEERSREDRIVVLRSTKQQKPVIVHKTVTGFLAC